MRNLGEGEKSGTGEAVICGVDLYEGVGAETCTTYGLEWT